MSADEPSDVSAPAHQRAAGSVRAVMQGGFVRDALCCMVLAVVVLGVYYPCLTADFVYDDSEVVIENPTVNARGVPLRDLLFLPFPSAQNSYHMYRPLTILSYRLNATGRHVDPALFHSVNVALHVLVTILLFAFLRRAFAPLLPAALGALLFAVLPGHAEAVLFVSARGDLLVAAACALGFLAVSRAPGTWPPALPTLLVLLGLYLAALLSKEPAVTFPCLVIVAGAVCAPTGLRYWQGGWRSWAALATFVVPLLVYVLLRASAIHELRPIESAPMAPAQLTGRLALASRLVAVAFTTLAWAPTPHVLYLWADPLRWDWQAISGVTLVAILLVVLVRCRDRAIRGGAAIAAIAFFPHLRLFGGLELFSERYLYLPSLGFCVLVAALLTRVRLGGWRTLATGLVLVWCLLLGSQTLGYASVWVDELNLWEYTHRVVPRSAKSHMNFAVALVKAGRYQEGMAAFRTLARVPGYEIRARKYLLAALTVLGEAEDGIRVAKTILKTTSDDPDVLFLLGRCQLRIHAMQELQATLAKLTDLARADDHAVVLANRLRLEASTGRPDERLPSWFLAPRDEGPQHP